MKHAEQMTASLSVVADGEGDGGEGGDDKLPSRKRKRSDIVDLEEPVPEVVDPEDPVPDFVEPPAKVTKIKEEQTPRCEIL
jgi:hypothetical protein